MRNFRLTIEYDGTGFHGWQVQPGLRTVQGELYSAFEEISKGPLKVTGAGRTDAGVHAAGQVASVLADTSLSPGRVLRAVRHKLPRDIFLREVDEAPIEFNARFDARDRTYHYIFIGRRTALWRRFYLPVPADLDIGAMREAVAALRGEHDFSSFTTAKAAKGGALCRVIRADLIDTPPLLTISLTADRFVHNMVRAIAGTVLEAGKGAGIDMEQVLAARERRAAGPTVPPHALYLMKVTY